ncbi:hypothetical protein GCM10010269_73260 [Streptomyces humidus]|uniref:Uncharacterized protein n=1 Tax=Streptomyces humidus TaxID=52259 RepID=A0A918G8M9_9ACTN|nr:hypothetical protein GCM10010269_73260 [Streptomyces humidus]
MAEGNSQKLARRAAESVKVRFESPERPAAFVSFTQAGSTGPAGSVLRSHFVGNAHIPDVSLILRERGN